MRSKLKFLGYTNFNPRSLCSLWPQSAGTTAGPLGDDDTVLISNLPDDITVRDIIDRIGEVGKIKVSDCQAPSAGLAKSGPVS